MIKNEINEIKKDIALIKDFDLQQRILDKISNIENDIKSTIDKKIIKALELLNYINPKKNDNELFFKILLNTAIDLVDEASYGSISILKNDKWFFKYAVGHDLRGLQSLNLKREWNLAQRTIKTIDYSKGEFQRNIPKDIFISFKNASLDIYETMLVSIKLNNNEEIIISIDIPKEREIHFSEQSKQVFKYLIDILDNYISIYNDNEDLNKINKELVNSKLYIDNYNNEISSLNKKLNNLIKLMTKFGSLNKGLEDFYLELLNSALNLIDEADYASVSVIDEKYWRFIASIGHDTKELKKLKIPSYYCYIANEVTVIKDIINNNPEKDRIPEKFAKKIKNASLPIKSTIIYSLKVNDKKYVNLSLDIKKDSIKEFSNESKEIFKSFVAVAKAFLRIKISSHRVKKSYMNLAEKLAILTNVFSDEEIHHNKRVGNLASLLGKYLGLPKEYLQDIQDFGSLFNIGKLFINKGFDDIDTKHCITAKSLLSDEYFKVAKNIAIYHHEHYDGTGKPYGLDSENIPIESQLIFIANNFDKLKRTYSSKEIIEIFENSKKGYKREWFNPILLEVLKDNIEKVNSVIYGENKIIF